MNTCVYRSILVVLLFMANTVIGVAQQSTKGERAPSLTADGVMSRTNVKQGSVLWKRYSPEGFGLSFELPGEPFERPYPISPELRSQIVHTKVLDYLDETLTVSIAHTVFSKPMDLKWMAQEMKSSMEHSGNYPNLKLSLVPKTDKILMRGGFMRLGTEVELRGFLLSSGKELWFISVQTPRAKPKGMSDCTRILESVTLSH